MDQTCPHDSILGHTEYSQPVFNCLGQTVALQTLTWDHLMDTAKEEVCYQGEEGGVEPVDGRQIGQQREGHPWKTEGKWAGLPDLCSWRQPPALLTHQLREGAVASTDCCFLGRRGQREQ